jgi:hypothetical protein
MMTPSPSPDELIIQQRGRRKIPVTFSPDIDAIKQVYNFYLIPREKILYLLNFKYIMLVNFRTQILVLYFIFYFTYLSLK